MFIKDWKKEVLTVPNLLSLFRLVLIPVYIVIYLKAQDAKDFYLSGSILAVSCLTDLIDGQIARRFNMVTNLGKALDPIADKAMQLTALICLVFHTHYSLVWVVILVGLKELLLGIGALVLYKSGIITQANWFGKVSCFISFACTLILLFPRVVPLDEAQAFWVAIAIVGANYMAFVSYIVAYINYQKQLKKSA